MADKTQPNVADMMTMWKATFLEFPLAGAKWGWGMGEEQEIAETAWKGYDAWVRLTSTSIDRLYKNSLFGEIAARSLDRTLRWQRLSRALVNAISAGLLPTVGLPTAAAVQVLHEEIQSLTTHSKAQDAQIRALHTDVRALGTDASVQRKRGRAPAARLGAPLQTLPAKMNTGTLPPTSA
jgi:hypothetical protein